MNKKNNLYKISETRKIILGVATLMIMLFHSFKLNINFSLFNSTKSMGNIGVEIFLMMSGIGLYFSYSKDNNVKYFYKKRLLRILPTVLPISLIYFMLIDRCPTILNFLSKFLLLDFFITGKRTFWYVSVIILLYLIYPIIHKIISKYDFKGFILLIIFNIGINIFLYYTFYKVYSLYEIALTRIPSFIFGVYLGKKVLNKEEISKLWLFPITLFGIISAILIKILNFHNSLIFIRYLYFPIAILIIFIISSIFNKKNKLTNILEFIGKYSLEIYMMYETTAKLLIHSWKHIGNTYLLYYILIGLIVLLVAIFLQFIINKIICIFNNKKS